MEANEGRQLETKFGVCEIPKQIYKKRQNYNLFEDDDERRKVCRKNANSSCVVGITRMTCGPLICLNHGRLSRSLSLSLSLSLNEQK